MANPMGPFCQSCSMPMLSPEQFGTDERGLRNNDYCSFCYVDGHFVKPDTTIDQMTELLVSMSDKMKMTPDQARDFAHNILPKLRRWRETPARHPAP